MNPPETAQENTYAQHRAELSGSIYTILFLVVTTFGFDRALTVYLDRLVHVRQISRWTFLVQYVDSWMAVVFLAELIIVVCFYRLGPLRMTLRDIGLTFSVPRLKELLWGFWGGLLAYAVSLPILLRLDRHSGLTGLLIGNFYHPAIILFVVLFAILLPIGSEVVFRGIIFKAFTQRKVHATEFLYPWFPKLNWPHGRGLPKLWAIGPRIRLQLHAGQMKGNPEVVLQQPISLAWFV